MTADHSAYLNRHASKPSFYKKLRVKRRLNRVFGDLYIGRRVKFAYLGDLLTEIGISATARMLEAGSGDGAFCFYLARRYPKASVTGLELNAIEAAVCQTIAAEEKRTNLRFEQGDITEMAYAEPFDFVITLDVLEEIEEDQKALEALFNALRPGGDLLIHMPHRHILQLNGSVVSVPDAESWKVTAGAVRQGYTPDELTEKLARCGFEVKRVKPVQGPPITKAFQLYEKWQRLLPLRILILPIVDAYIRQDKQKEPAHGNSMWIWARKP